MVIRRFSGGLAGFACALALAAPVALFAQQKAAASVPSPGGSVSAGSGVFRCVDGDGKVEYRNVGDTKGCKKIETETVNTMPFPRAAAKGPETRPSTSRVESGAQRGRDNDRRRILEDELASEEKRLVDLRQEYNKGEPERRGDERNYQRYVDRVDKLKADIARSEANIDSLKRELTAARN